MQPRRRSTLPSVFWFQFALWNAACYHKEGERFYTGYQLDRYRGRLKKVVVKKLPCYSTAK